MSPRIARPPDEAVEEFVRRVRDWLTVSNQNDLRQLVRWLTGLDLGPVLENQNPYPYFAEVALHGTREDWILLVHYLRLLLDQEPDGQVASESRNRYLYNLLKTCAEISAPNILGRALLPMFKRRKLDGSWRGHSLRKVLLDALSINQFDYSLLRVWQDMLQGQPHDWLGGGVIEGDRGMQNIPPVKSHSDDLGMC